jgi:hypothetical protein
VKKERNSREASFEEERIRMRSRQGIANMSGARVLFTTSYFLQSRLLGAIESSQPGLLLRRVTRGGTLLL